MTAADLHQSRLHYGALHEAIDQHRPDVLALVGDVLDLYGFSSKKQFVVAECAKRLAELPVKHLVFTRGNHEDHNWSDFVNAWPHDLRPLLGLYASSYTVGHLKLIGFPCYMGCEMGWCNHLIPRSNQMEVFPISCTQPLGQNHSAWLPGLMRRLGIAGRTIWLMHEPPLGAPLARAVDCNQDWGSAVKRFSPFIVVSGHGHEAPLRSGRWHAKLQQTHCVNVGQSESQFHYALFDFESAASNSLLPRRIVVKALPWNETFAVTPGL